MRYDNASGQRRKKVEKKGRKRDVKIRHIQSGRALFFSDGCNLRRLRLLGGFFFMKEGRVILSLGCCGVLDAGRKKRMFYTTKRGLRASFFGEVIILRRFRSDQFLRPLSASVTSLPSLE